MKDYEDNIALGEQVSDKITSDLLYDFNVKVNIYDTRFLKHTLLKSFQGNCSDVPDDIITCNDIIRNCNYFTLSEVLPQDKSYDRSTYLERSSISAKQAVQSSNKIIDWAEEPKEE